MDQVQAIAIVVVLAAALITTVTDLWSFKIYNILTVPLLLSGFSFHYSASGMSGLQGSFLGALFGFAALLPFYVMGGMGAGDVKLMAAIGAWLGLPVTFTDPSGPAPPRRLQGSHVRRQELAPPPGDGGALPWRVFLSTGWLAAGTC